MVTSGAAKRCGQERTCVAETRSRAGLTGHYFARDDARGQVHPLLLAVAQRGQPDPVEDLVFVAADFKDNFGGRPVQEMNPAAAPLPFEEKTADAVARQAGECVLAPGQRKAG